MRFSQRSLLVVYFFKPSEWSDSPLKFSWDINIPPKLQIFFGSVFQGKILSNEQRAKRQLTVDLSCSLCGWPIEPVLHILCDCEKAKSVWSLFLSNNLSLEFFQLDFQPWLRVNLLTKSHWQFGISWNISFAFTC